MIMSTILLVVLWAILTFLTVVPSDNPKSWRSHVQELKNRYFMWKFTLYVYVWGGLAAIIMSVIVDMILYGW